MNQRKEIEELLIGEPDSSQIIESALDANFTLDEIVQTLVAYGVDTLVYNTWVRKTFARKD